MMHGLGVTVPLAAMHPAATMNAAIFAPPHKNSIWLGLLPVTPSVTLLPTHSPSAQFLLG